MLETDKVLEVLYEKANNDITARHIIPTTIPSAKITAIDVTDLDDSQRDELIVMHTAYSLYIKRAFQQVFNFEDWVSMTTGKDCPDVKWRSFNIDRLKEAE